MVVQAQPPTDQRLEMAGEEIGEIERAGLFLREGLEGLIAGIEGVAMRAVDAGHALLRQHPVELAAGAAIAIEEQDPRRRRQRGSSPASARGFAGTVVQ